jgi:hypothetical protein
MKRLFITLLLCLLCLPGFAVGESGLDLGSGDLCGTYIVACATNAQVIDATPKAVFFKTVTDSLGEYDGIATATLKSAGRYEISISGSNYENTNDASAEYTCYVNGAILLYPALRVYPFSAHSSTGNDIGVSFARAVYTLAAGSKVSFQVVKAGGANQATNYPTLYFVIRRVF